MCGIVGVLRLDGKPLDRGVLNHMTAALGHRGPERRGVQLSTTGSVQVGFGHTRLKIIDLSEAASQPMLNEDESIWVTFNGEIYNFRELRASLVSRGVKFRTSSDTEVILRLYEVQGDRCVEALDGMFAFAVWDSRRRHLLLARDRVGKKPLFYYATPSVFAFASEIKALIRYPDIPAELDPTILPAFFFYGYTPTPSTFYRGIKKLPPGHLLRVDADALVSLEAYWALPIPPSGSCTLPSEREAANEVRELVTAAVRRRLIADVPVGAFLSGGIDSSVVVGVMSQVMREPVKTFSIGFTGDAHFDETAYARLASKRFKTQYTEFIVEPSAIDLVERLVWYYDEPFADSSAIPTYLLSRLTREHVTVALTGDGGDEVFAGYPRFYAALLAERIPVWIRQMAERLLSGLPEWGGHRSTFRRFKKFADSAALPFNERFSRWVSVFSDDLPSLLPGVQDGPLRQSLSLLDAHLQHCEDMSPLSQLLYLNLKMYLVEDLLVKMDRCSMAHALEVRSPFLDRELMEYVWRLPDNMKLRWGKTKVILRRAFVDMLPQQILQRGKMGFGVPLRTWFTRDLRDYLHDLVLAPDTRLKAYIDQRYVGRLYQEHLSGRADHSHRLWTLLTFEVWLRQLALHPGSLSAHTPSPALSDPLA